MRVEATGFRQTIAVLKELGDEVHEPYVHPPFNSWLLHQWIGGKGRIEGYTPGPESVAGIDRNRFVGTEAELREFVQWYEDWRANGANELHDVTQYMVGDGRTYEVRHEDAF